MELVRLLDRVPILSSLEKSAIGAALNVALPEALLGVGRGWEHKELAKIDDERQLHRILLALFRAEADTPLYAHIRHGPFEYGKDLVVCRDHGDKTVLTMYSVKKGQIKKADWNKEVRQQLEEIFQVDLRSPEVPYKYDERVGVLVWNDHLHPHLEPIVDGWVRDQLRAFGRRYELMNIDSIVRYVRERRLNAVLLQALRDEGLLA